MQQMLDINIYKTRHHGNMSSIEKMLMLHNTDTQIQI